MMPMTISEKPTDLLNNDGFACVMQSLSIHEAFAGLYLYTLCLSEN
jgi:hypothetical protein